MYFIGKYSSQCFISYFFTRIKLQSFVVIRFDTGCVLVLAVFYYFFFSNSGG